MARWPDPLPWWRGGDPSLGISEVAEFTMSWWLELPLLVVLMGGRQMMLDGPVLGLALSLRVGPRSAILRVMTEAGRLSYR
jgi:hypothetical protein